MRLTQIKLAGFKSFVDPTPIGTPGQLVGIVGPNGCGKSRIAVAGEIPNPLDPPPGCAFHPRCPYADERCRRERPMLKAASHGGEVACHAVEENRLSSPAQAVPSV